MRDDIRMKNASGPEVSVHDHDHDHDNVHDHDLQVVLYNVGVESIGNYTCLPFNDVGRGEGASVGIRVTIPPTLVRYQTFVKSTFSPNFAPRGLKGATGAPLGTSALALVCVVECAPSCTITWSVIHIFFLYFFF